MPIDAIDTRRKCRKASESSRVRQLAKSHQGVDVGRGADGIVAAGAGDADDLIRIDGALVKTGEAKAVGHEPIPFINRLRLRPIGCLD